MTKEINEKVKTWTREYLEGLFGAEYVISAPSFMRSTEKGFYVQKRDNLSMAITYSKNFELDEQSNARFSFISATVHVNCMSHRIRCYGERTLSCPSSDELMVKQAKQVLNW